MIKSGVFFPLISPLTISILELFVEIDVNLLSLLRARLAK